MQSSNSISLLVSVVVVIYLGQKEAVLLRVRKKLLDLQKSLTTRTIRIMPNIKYVSILESYPNNSVLKQIV